MGGSFGAEQALGWACEKADRESVSKIVSENEFREILALRDNTLVYAPKKLRELSLDEALLLKECLEFFRKSHSLKISISPQEALKKYCDENSISLNELQGDYLEKIFSALTMHESILSFFLEDDNLEEICIIGTGRAKPLFVFDRDFGWLATNTSFFSDEEINGIVNSVAAESGRRATLRKPIVNCFMKNGSRMNACIEPIAGKGTTVTIRKFSKSPFTPTDLASMGSACFEQLAFLWLAIESDCSIIICGNTGSGKTTLLNSLVSFVPKNERILIAEETPEIVVPHVHNVKMSVCEETGISLPEIITNTLRMRPDRVIVGEARNSEDVRAMMDSMLAGQGKGTYATFHAQSAKECLQRLRKLGTMEMDLDAIDLIVVQKRWTKKNRNGFSEQRKITEIAETILKESKVEVKKIFEYDFESQKFVMKSPGEKAFEKICMTHGFDKKDFEREMGARADFLKTLKGKNMGEFFDAVNSEYL